MDRRADFHRPSSHGFLRVAACTPAVRLADPATNVERTLDLAREVAGSGAGLAVFPELGLSGYSNEDLFHQDALLDGVAAAAARLIEASAELAPVLVVGAPLRFGGRLFNCAVVACGGRVLGIVPKSYLPNYREFYEKRHFASARHVAADTVRFLGSDVPFGNDLVFEAESLPDFRLHVEICEDLWAPIPPSTFAALAGATVLANLSASNVIIGKADYRRKLCASQSAKCLAAYVYTGAGAGESTTDLAWDAHALIHENDELLAESVRFARQPGAIQADVDLERLRQDRMRMTTFLDCAAEHRVPERRVLPFAFEVPRTAGPLARPLDRFPYVPADRERLDERCYEAYSIQVAGLAQRMEASGIAKLVIGVSGGLDSTQALIVAVRACDRLGLPRANVLGYSLPGFATSRRTRESAARLMRALGVTAGEIDIRPACERVLAEIEHPYSRGEPVYDVTFENVQAGERTSRLFRLANRHGALVVGTSDLSELALGWTTYGVGDHMSHYAVNASVPKTLIRHLIRWSARTRRFDADTGAVLEEIAETAISPELVPGGAADERPHQDTEAVVGPFELQDFHLYFISRYGFRPSKVAFLAHQAWGDAARGNWPDDAPAAARREYDLATIKKWLGVFLLRFFQTSQFKRSAIPNAPKVGSGGSLSPRADWRAPSDASADTWLAELRAGVPER